MTIGVLGVRSAQRLPTPSQSLPMPKIVKRLTDQQVKNARWNPADERNAKNKPRHFDGGGLYLEIAPTQEDDAPTGGKLWRFKYQRPDQGDFAMAHNVMSFGKEHGGGFVALALMTPVVGYRRDGDRTRHATGRRRGLRRMRRCRWRCLQRSPSRMALAAARPDRKECATRQARTLASVRASGLGAKLIRNYAHHRNNWFYIWRRLVDSCAL